MRAQKIQQLRQKSAFKIQRSFKKFKVRKTIFMIARGTMKCIWYE